MGELEENMCFYLMIFFYYHPVGVSWIRINESLFDSTYCGRNSKYTLFLARVKKIAILHSATLYCIKAKVQFCRNIPYKKKSSRAQIHMQNECYLLQKKNTKNSSRIKIKMQHTRSARRWKSLSRGSRRRLFPWSHASSMDLPTRTRWNFLDTHRHIMFAQSVGACINATGVNSNKGLSRYSLPSISSSSIPLSSLYSFAWMSVACTTRLSDDLISLFARHAASHPRACVFIRR